MDKFFHSVYLDEDLCMGCINCIKRCPTQAIRVRHGKACITSKFCIDCGECVRICSHHAKLIRRDTIDVIHNYKYTVALPAPSLYSQFNNLDDVNIVLTALIYLGFDDVFEVSAAAELVSAASRKYVEAHHEKWPLISTACPSVVRLIRVRFPNLIDHLLPLNPPVEVAARLARKRAAERTGLKPEEIGIVFISPCPSKVTFVQSPLGVEHSSVDNVIAIKDIYPMMLPEMKRAEKNPKDLAMSGKIGVGWGGTGGEAGGLITDSYLAADGIENVIRVLEDLEDEKFGHLQFIELNACNGGCVGGVLTIENPFVAKAKLKRLNKYMPVSMTHLDDYEDAELDWTTPVQYEPVFRLGKNFSESITMLNRVEALCNEFPGLDCGACGAPTCRALAEDIVRGDATMDYCIPYLKNHIHKLSNNYMSILDSLNDRDAAASINVGLMKDYVRNLAEEISLLDARLEEQNAGVKNKRPEDGAEDTEVFPGLDGTAIGYAPATQNRAPSAQNMRAPATQNPRTAAGQNPRATAAQNPRASAAQNPRASAAQNPRTAEDEKYAATLRSGCPSGGDCEHCQQICPYY